MEELPDIQNRQRAICELLKTTVQPYVVICGKLDDIRQSMVVVNDTTYNLPDPMEAVDTCFKIFFALNTRYPAICYHIWVFIAEYVFKIKVEKRLYMRVFHLMEALERSK